jgi:hypothetical protein
MEAVFDETVRILNQTFACDPILYASFGMEKGLGIPVNAKDIDLLIPKNILIQRSRLIQAFQSNGFASVLQEVLTFQKNGIRVELAEQEKWMIWCHFSAHGISRITENKHTFQLLDAANLLLLYEFLVSDPSRSETKRVSDRQKIAWLRQYLMKTNQS